MFFVLIFQQLNKKELKGGALSPESPDESCDGTQGPYQLTPRTEAKYSKIDEEFQLLMQSQRMARVNITFYWKTEICVHTYILNNYYFQNNVSANYSLPTTMPVNNMYNDSGNLQLQHNASPRPPSSSDADSG